MSIREPLGGWLDNTSETILEVLRLSGPLRLDELQSAVKGRDQSVNSNYSILLYNIRTLRETGLVSQRNGRFSISTAGESYLAGEIDAQSLSYGLQMFSEPQGDGNKQE